MKLIFMSLLMSSCFGAKEPVMEPFQQQSSIEGITPIGSQASETVIKYDHEGKSSDVEWMSCGAAKPVGFAFMMNRDGMGFDRTTFCSSWLAQAALLEGVTPVAINRPGYGRSTGKVDFSGTQSQTAISAAIKSAREKLSIGNAPQAIWGHSTGAIAALFASKKEQSFSFLVVGSAIFDTQETRDNAKDPFIVGGIERMVTSEGAKAHERRSIAWDAQGLPKQIFLYHGKEDQDVAYERATDFRDSLEGASYEVFFEGLEKTQHELPTELHFRILRHAMKRFAFAQTPKAKD
jgi:predicted esterase